MNNLEKLQSQSEPKLLKAFPVPGCVAADHPQLSNQFTTEDDSAKQSKTRRRQKRCNTREETVMKYKNDLEEVWVPSHRTITTWFNPSLTLECKHLDDQDLPVGFVKTREGRYQYNFTDPESESGRRFRPCAYRIPFLLEEGFYDDAMTVSHLCHNNLCHNWDHHVLESLPVNKGRNGCPGGPSCRHKVKCLIPGEYSEM